MKAYDAAVKTAQKQAYLVAEQGRVLAKRTAFPGSQSDRSHRWEAIRRSVLAREESTIGWLVHGDHRGMPLDEFEGAVYYVEEAIAGLRKIEAELTGRPT